MLSVQQILKAALSAGWTGSTASIATAIAIAESGCDEFNVGDKKLAWSNGPAIGLWQINIGKHADAKAEGFNLFVPEVNAEYAFKIYVAAGFQFRPWSTYTQNKYLDHLAQVAAVVNG